MIYVHLLANGIEMAVVPVTEENNWLFTFDELPKYEDGKEIIYTVIEETVPNYTTEIEGTTITNRYQPNKTSFTVTKAWEDKDDEKQARADKIMVQLYANELKKGDPIELNEGNH